LFVDKVVKLVCLVRIIVTTGHGWSEDVHAILSPLLHLCFCSIQVVECNMMSNIRILRATRKIVEGDVAGEENFYEDFEVFVRCFDVHL
jgi:hypothetical protein